MTGSRSFQPNEFLDLLKRDEIHSPITLHGMVKPVEDDADHLLFAQGQVCQDWISVPLSSIETISVQSSVSCGDHAHPLVSLELKQPETDEGRLFAALLRTTSARARSGPSGSGAQSHTRRYDKATLLRSPERPAPAREGRQGGGEGSSSRDVPHGPDAGDLLPSCSGCPAWVDDHGWFGILAGCSDTTCDYEEY